MINLNKKDSVADAVKSILQQEETDVKSRTKDDIGGKKKTTQVDDVGPGADGKSTKVKLASEETKKLSSTTTEVTEKPEPQEIKDANKDEKNKKQLRMKESTTLKGFKARYEEHTIFDQMIAEVLSKDASAGEWIHDFVHSDNPKFAGKSKAERKKQALAAYYAKQRNEEIEGVDEALKGNQKKIDKNHNNKIDAQDFKILRKEKSEQVDEAMGEKAAGNLDFINKVKGVAKKVGRVLGGPDDEGHKKDLQRKMGIPQTGKPNHAKYNEEVEQADEAFNANAALERAKSDDKKKAQGYEKVGPYTFRKKQDDKKPVQKEEVEQIDELSKKTIKSYILKKHDKMYSNPAQEPKKARKDLDNLTGAMHRSTGVKPTSEETVEEGWDDMLADVKKRNAPQPNGGSGKKQGSRYGGSKQKDTPEQDDDKMKKEEVEHLDETMTRKHFQQVADVIKAHPDQAKRNELAKHHAEIFKASNPRFDHARFYKAAGAEMVKENIQQVDEGKRPEDDSVPFAPPYSKTPSEVTDKSGAKHTPMSRAHHLARLAMKKVKADLGNKGK